MTDHVFLRIMQLKMFGFYFVFLNCLHHRIKSNNCNSVILQFVQYSLSFAGTPKIEIPGAALELSQLKIKQFSPYILKFSTKRKKNHFTLNCFMVRRSFLLIFHAGSRRLGANNFRNSSYKEKTTG